MVIFDGPFPSSGDAVLNGFLEVMDCPVEQLENSPSVALKGGWLLVENEQVCPAPDNPVDKVLLWSAAHSVFAKPATAFGRSLLMFSQGLLGVSEGQVSREVKKQLAFLGM